MEFASKKIDEYLSHVCSYIKNKDVHNEVSEELREHLYEIYYEELDKDLSDEEAVEKAIKRMGDSNILGNKLNKVHKAKPDYISLIAILIIASAGIASMFFGLEGPFKIINSVKALAVGTVIGIVLYYCDYRKLEKYSLYIYIGTILTTTFLFKISNIVNGRPDKVVAASTLIVIAFLISLSGLMSRLNLKKFKNVMLLFFMMFISLITLLIIPDMMLAAIYLITLICVFLISSAKNIYKGIFIGIQALGFIPLFIFSILQHPYRMYRLQNIINPIGSHENELNYMYVQSNNILKSAGLFGKNISMSNIELAQMHTNFAFSYMVYSLGWIVTIIVLAAIGLFIVRNLFLVKKIKNDFGRYIVFSIVFLISILGSFGLIGLSYTVPFISYGGSNLVSNIVMTGILMSVYRRKNLKNLSDAIRI